MICRFLVAALVSTFAANLWAGEAAGNSGEKTPNAKAGEARGKNAVLPPGASALGGSTWYIDYIDRIVKLTDEQKKAMTEIIDARNQAAKEFQTENAHKLRAANAAMIESFRSRDREAIAKAQREYQELYAPMHEMMKKSQSDLTNVMTPEQKAAFRDFQLMTAVRNMVAPVQLSDEQIQQIKANSKAGDLGGFGGKIYQTVQQVLTPEQKTTIAKHRAMSYVKAAFGHAKLSADQMKQVEAACDELAQNPAFNDGRLYPKLTEKVNALLTDEQKEAMKKAPHLLAHRAGPPDRPRRRPRRRCSQGAGK